MRQLLHRLHQAVTGSALAFAAILTTPLASHELSAQEPGGPTLVTDARPTLRIVVVWNGVYHMPIVLIDP